MMGAMVSAGVGVGVGVGVSPLLSSIAVSLDTNACEFVEFLLSLSVGGLGGSNVLLLLVGARACPVTGVGLWLVVVAVTVVVAVALLWCHCVQPNPAILANITNTGTPYKAADLNRRLRCSCCCLLTATCSVFVPAFGVFAPHTTPWPPSSSCIVSRDEKMMFLDVDVIMVCA